MDLGSRISAVLAVDPSAPAVYAEVGDLTWGHVQAHVDALDTILDGRGLGAGTQVALVLRNRPAHLAATIATLATRRCVVTVSPLASDRSLAADLAATDAAAVVATGDDLARPGVLAAAQEDAALVIELTEDPSEPLRVRHEGDGRAPAAPDVAVRMLTSGTTGPPKRVDLTYRALEQSLRGVRHYESDPSEGVRLHTRAQVCTSPLVHISGLWNVVQAVVEGRPTALLERFAVEPFVAAVRRHQPPVCGLTPTAIRMILDADVAPSDLASLRALIVGTAPTPPGLVDQFLDAYGIPILVVYGATEFAGGVAGWTLKDFRSSWPAKRGGVGRAHPGVELRVVDETGAVLASGEIGILEVRSAQLDGVGGSRGDAWVRTNDLAWLDDDGFLFIAGRADDVINRGGFKVSPTKVAEVLQQHPGVREAGVTGLDDERLGAVPVAAVETTGNGSAPTEDELLAFAREHLAPYEVPRSILVVDTLPRTPSMKVSQPELRRLFG